MVGCGAYLPPRIVTNDELCKIVDTSDEWIIERTGIIQRHFAESDQKTSDLATAAAKSALDHAGLSAQDIDLIVLATTTPDYTFPATATLVQHNLGNRTALAFDVAAACSGYLVALNIVDMYLKTGQAQHAMVIGADVYSRLLDMEDRRTCVLFGDGAGAVIFKAVPATETDRGIMGVHMQSDGGYTDLLYAGGAPTEQALPKITMVGREVYKHAVTKLTDAATSILQRYQIQLEQVDWMIPHQANLRIIEGMAKKLHMPMNKVVTTVQQHSNTSAASIPLALTTAIHDGRVQPGQIILHEAIGGGLVWGAALLRS